MYNVTDNACIYDGFSIFNDIIYFNILIFISIGALEIQMSVCLSVCLLVCRSVTFTHNSVIFDPRSFKFCVVVDIEVTDKSKMGWAT